MPDLGKYSVEVLTGYGVTIVLLAALIVLTWLRSRKIRAALAETEASKTDA